MTTGIVKTTNLLTFARVSCVHLHHQTTHLSMVLLPSSNQILKMHQNTLLHQTLFFLVEQRKYPLTSRFKICFSMTTAMASFNSSNLATAMMPRTLTLTSTKLMSLRIKNYPATCSFIYCKVCLLLSSK